MPLNLRCLHLELTKHLLSQYFIKFSAYWMYYCHRKSDKNLKQIRPTFPEEVGLFYIKN